MAHRTHTAVRAGLRPLAALAFFALLALALSGCSASTGVSPLTGRYELRAVNGSAVPVDALGGALSGELVFLKGGRVSRTVTYARSGLPTPVSRSASGKYSVRGSELTLELLDQGPASTPLWTARGELRGSSILLRYPSAVDGTMIEEEYVGSR